MNHPEADSPTGLDELQRRQRLLQYLERRGAVLHCKTTSFEDLSTSVLEVMVNTLEESQQRRAR